MTKHLRLLETLRNSSAGLKEISHIIDKAILDIENIEDPNVETKESDVIMSELGDMITDIKKDSKNRKP